LVTPLRGRRCGRRTHAYACPEGLSAACRSAEWHLKLPLHRLLHVISGVIEFAAITMAVYVAWKRTREDSGWVSLAVKGVAIAMLIDYPYSPSRT